MIDLFVLLILMINGAVHEHSIFIDRNSCQVAGRSMKGDRIHSTYCVPEMGTNMPSLGKR